MNRINQTRVLLALQLIDLLTYHHFFPFFPIFFHCLFFSALCPFFALFSLQPSSWLFWVWNTLILLIVFFVSLRDLSLCNNLSPTMFKATSYIFDCTPVWVRRVNVLLRIVKIFMHIIVIWKFSKHPSSAFQSPLSSYLLLFWKHPATTRQYIMHSISAAFVYYKEVIIFHHFVPIVCNSSLFQPAFLN